MDITAIQKFYCKCYAEVMYAVSKKGVSAIRDMLNTVPGGLFCTKVYKADNIFNFEFNGIKLSAKQLNADRVRVTMYGDVFEVSEAEQLVDTLFNQNAFPDRDQMMTVEFIRNWYKAMNALPRNNNMNGVLSLMMLFLEDADK